MHDALRLGKRRGEDPSGGKQKQPASINIDDDNPEARNDNIGTKMNQSPSWMPGNGKEKILTLLLKKDISPLNKPLAS